MIIKSLDLFAGVGGLRLGLEKALKTSKLLHLITFSVLIYIGSLSEFGLLYWIGSIIFSFFLLYQHTLISKNNLTKINIAFFTTNGIASLLFGLFVILDLLT